MPECVNSTEKYTFISTPRWTGIITARKKEKTWRRPSCFISFPPPEVSAGLWRGAQNEGCSQMLIFRLRRSHVESALITALGPTVPPPPADRRRVQGIPSSSQNAFPWISKMARSSGGSPEGPAGEGHVGVTILSSLRGVRLWWLSGD